MSKIIFYDATPMDTSQIKPLLGEDHDASFESAVLDKHNIDPAAEIISIFVGSQVGRDVMELMPKLKLIACRSTGFNNVDLAGANRLGIQVATVPSYGEHTVAEYAVGLMLMLSRRLGQAVAALKSGHTDHSQLMGLDLHGKTLGVVGAGRIGRQVAGVGRALGMKVLAYDAKPQIELAKGIGYEYESLDDLLRQADVVSLHLPALEETNHMMNAQRLSLMKSTALLVNTSRGAVIDTVALLSALESNQLAGAALDVFEGEDLAEINEELRVLKAEVVDKLALKEAAQIHVLASMPNVILTNHNAYNTIEAIERINRTTVHNITAFMAGRPENLAIS